MNHIFITIFILLCSMSVNANEQRLQILDSYLMTATQDVTTSVEDLDKKYNEIEMELNQSLESEPNSPIVWYLKALIEDARIRVILRKIGKPYDSSIEAYKKRSADAFSRAMELDKTYEPHLTADMYYWKAKHLPIDLKLEAYRQVLKFEGFGEYPSMRSNVYGNLLMTLYDAGRYEEAIEIMNQMIVDPEWLNITKNPSERSERVQAIKGKIAKFEQKIQERDGKTIVNEKDEPVQEKTETTQKTPVTSIDEQQPDVKTEDTQKNHEDTLETNNNKAFIIGIVLAVLLLVGFVAVKRKKK